MDHKDPRWERQYQMSGRENGAATYSRDIVTHHVPLWDKWAEGRQVLVSTCPLLEPQGGRGDVAVQYLHEYRYEDPFGAVRAVQRALSGYPRLVFVTSYASLANLLISRGLEAWYVPMAVDVSTIQTYRTDPRPDQRVAYFGNVTRPKRALTDELCRQLSSAGWKIDHVSRPNQREAWSLLGKYRYGIGVGRCALEMGALGMRVMISGAAFGGIMTTPEEIAVQRSVNMNGRVITFDRSPLACVAGWELAVPGVTYDIESALSRLGAYLERT